MRHFWNHFKLNNNIFYKTATIGVYITLLALDMILQACACKLYIDAAIHTAQKIKFSIRNLSKNWRKL